MTLLDNELTNRIDPIPLDPGEDALQAILPRSAKRSSPKGHRPQLRAETASTASCSRCSNTPAS